MSTEFKKGDLVKLKSGGPKMTISSFPDRLATSLGQDPKWECQWFSGTKLQSGWFPLDALEKVSDDEE